MTDVWPARRSRVGDAALWVACAILALGLLCLIAAATRDVGQTLLMLTIAAVVLIAAGTAFAAWALAYRRLVYVLTDSAVHVRWMGETLVVPYSAIEGIYTGQRLVGHATPSVPYWPGIYVGPGRLRGTGRLRFFATSPDPSALTLISVEHGGFVLSARNPQDFRAALIERVEQSPETPRPDHVYSRPADTAPWSALVDRWLPACVAASVVLLLVVLALVVYGLPNLRDLIPLHFNASGEPSQIGPKQDLLRLPLLGLLLLCLDVGLGVWRHPADRLLARVLWVGSVALQAALVVAVVRLLQ
ncbi:MAG: DUF1648 domain-containing protein [Chloroflexi bacterium]|nr:DUF1648 domain-containing protein [Chloroflexota bacterium]